MARVVLAMSGGVDSSVAAVLLKRAGHEVIGMFMRTGDHGHHGDERPDRKKGCCSALDAGDARCIADKLDLPFYALNFEKEFNQIIDYFADEYIQGRTPNPCVVCNNWLKFGKLWAFGKQLGADMITTGHYAQVVRNADGVNELHRAVDPEKDQSYVLHGIKNEVLQHLLFPIGGYRKDEIRAIAREAGLPVADKPDSVEICFVPSGDHAALIRERRPELDTAGIVVDKSGETLGEHTGYERFTIGQRKGLGIAGEKKRYVLDIIPDSKMVVLGDQEDLEANGLTASRVNWLIEPPMDRPLRCEAKIRYRHKAVPAETIASESGAASVRFDLPQSAVTPGQAVVFYDGPKVLGGGWIESAIR